MATAAPAWRPLTAAERAEYEQRGFVVLRGAFDEATMSAITAWTDQVALLGHLGVSGMHHFEEVDGKSVLARSEALVESHPGFRRLLTEGALIRWAAECLGEEAAFLFKEKANWKASGGAGFAPHQDATAYRFADSHVSIMVPVDAAYPANGGLSFSPGPHREVLPNNKGVIDPEVVASLPWEDVSVLPGDVVLFSSYAPHRSGPNTTPSPRRALYLTYNPASAGDVRQAYYDDKRAELEAREARRRSGSGAQALAQLSINEDFLGRHAERPPRPPPRPLEELLQLYRGPQAHQPYDEAVSELQHALRCAACARRDGADDAAVAAALLHDVGHLVVGDLFPADMELDKDWKHEETGAAYLSVWFPPSVVEPVRLHVAAKRYLVATDPTYAAKLSTGSVRSLAVQGGPMTEEECAAFRRLEGFGTAVALRRWDDDGKDPSMEVPGLEAYVDMLRGLSREA